ncbi:MAG: TIGR01777 family oxidoreductase [Planctomycetota bacterium]|jgi:uncharacterized protein (TIGR01777 family)
MKVVVTGATGFIGQVLCNMLVNCHQVVALTRNVQKAKSALAHSVEIMSWDGRNPGKWQNCIDNSDAIINLAGTNVASGRWTTKKKHNILNSRLDTIRALSEAISSSKVKPKVFIQSSAIGYYGSRGTEPLDEDSESGNGFLAEVCKEVELKSREFESLGLRLVIIRSGVVLGSRGGALPRMIRPFRFYAGGILGRGRQLISWIILDDEISAIKHLLENDTLKGIFNLTSPSPVTNRDFFKAVGRVLNRPCWLAVPVIALKILLGEMGEELLLSSQKVYPKRLLDEGFKFMHSDLRSALNMIINERS